MSRGRRATALPLLIGIGFLLSACVESVGYSTPVSGYAYSAYDSPYWGWGGWHHGWDHGHWDGHVEVAHAGGGWGHGLAGHGGFGGHGGGGHGGGGGGHR
jgi:hypothetical protein